MNAAVLWGYVPALLVAALGVVVVLCRRYDNAVAVEEQRAEMVEQRRVDAEFADIVATTLADLEGERP